MSHPRTLIREAAKDALIGQTVAGTNVLSTRKNPLSVNPSALAPMDNLPAVIVFSRTTKTEVFDESPRRYRCQAEIVVEGLLHVTAETDDDIDTILDDFELELWNAMLGDDTLGKTCNDLTAVSSDIDLDSDGARLLGAVIMVFNAEYFVDAPANGTGTMPIGEFDKAYTDFSLDGSQDDTADRGKTRISGLST